MTRKQRKAWMRLSPAKRKRYIRRAEKEVQRGNAGQGIVLKKKSSALPSREMKADFSDSQSPWSFPSGTSRIPERNI